MHVIRHCHQSSIGLWPVQWAIWSSASSVVCKVLLRSCPRSITGKIIWYFPLQSLYEYSIWALSHRGQGWKNRTFEAQVFRFACYINSWLLVLLARSIIMNPLKIHVFVWRCSHFISLNWDMVNSKIFTIRRPASSVSIRSGPGALKKFSRKKAHWHLAIYLLLAPPLL